MIRSRLPHSRVISGLVAPAALLAASLSAAPARAQMMHVPETDWRQPDRHDAIVALSKPAKFYFEVRFGTYQPAIDSEDKVSGSKPYEKVFGTAPLFHFGLEFDAVPIRIPYVGAFGLGVGWGFSHASAKAIYTAGPNVGQASFEDTSLTIMPMHASFVLRADELMRRTGIPLVPYGKAGFSLAYWNASNSVGTEELCGSAGSLSKCTAGGMPVASGNGLTPGLHFAVGGMLALNWIEPQASARLDQTTGVHHAYLFGEYYNDRITLSSHVMHVGTSSWVAGLAADF